MSSIPTATQRAEQQRDSRGGPLAWGLRVALAVAVIDILSRLPFGYGIPEIFSDYYLFPQRPLIAYVSGRADTGLIGQMVLLAASVALGFALAYLLAQRPFWMRGFLRAAGATPTAAAISAVTTVFLTWSALVFLLGPLTGIAIEATFKYEGALFFVLLLHVVTFVFAGFAAARGDEGEARRRGALAGLVCGVVVALLLGAISFVYFDAFYASVVGGGLLIVFAALGYYAGAQGARLWRAEGTVAPRRSAPSRPRPRGAVRGLRGLRLGGGVLWGAIGLLLVTVFLPAPYSPIDAAEKGTDTGQRFALFGFSLVSTWLLIVGVVVVAVALVLGLRAAWPSLGPVRRAIRDAVLYALAIGGMGDRVRSRAFVRMALAAMLVTLFFWPYVDKYFLGAGSDARVSTLGDMGFYVILALGLNVVVGFAGLLDLGYVAFFAFGAYTWAVLGAPQFEKITGLFAQLNGFPSIPRVLPFGAPWAVLFWPGLLIGALVGAFFGILLGAPTLRLRGDYLAIVTLGFGEIVPVVFKNMDKLTLGTNGISGIATPIFPGITFPWIASTTPFFYLMLGLIAIAIVCNIRLRDSRLGRAWVAIREDEIAAAASGINTVRTKLFAFATGAFFSGMAGVYSASKLGIIAPDKFSFGDSIIYLAMVVLGGIGSIPGVIVGAAIIASLNLYILIQLNVQASSLTPDSPVYFLHSIDFSLLRNFIFGGMLIVMMLLRPQGLIPSARRKAELTGEVAEETSGPVEDALDAAVGGPAYTEERVQ